MSDETIDGTGASPVPASPGPAITVPAIGPESTAREVIRTAIARSVEHFLAELPGARAGDQPEPLHQARVSVRRLRSDLRTFGPLLDRAWSDPLRDELKWLGGSLGRVRDLDVLLIVLGELGDGRRDDGSFLDADDMARLTGHFSAQRDDARAHLLADLADERATRLVAAMVDAAGDPHTAPQADDPAGELLPPLARKPWRAIERAVDRLGDPASDSDLHRVRILAKRCRYAADAVAPTVGKPARRFAKAMADIQTCLGDLNDAVVIGHRLRVVAEESPDVGFVAGQVAALLSRRAVHCRADFPGVWSTAADPRLRRWFR